MDIVIVTRFFETQTGDGIFKKLNKSKKLFELFVWLELLMDVLMVNGGEFCSLGLPPETKA